MSLKLLGDNWKSIMSKVVTPLWNNEFCNEYNKMKMDKDDFDSMVGEELTKAFITYNPSESNIYTYARMVIKKKAKTELRNAARQKRFGDVCAISIYKKENGGNDILLEEIIEDIEDKNTVDDTEVRLVIADISKLLKLKERKIIAMAIDDYSDDEIARRLHIKTSDISKLKADLEQRSDIRRIVKKYGYLGGNE